MLSVDVRRCGAALAVLRLAVPHVIPQPLESIDGSCRRSRASPVQRRVGRYDSCIPSPSPLRSLLLRLTAVLFHHLPYRR